MPGCYGTSKEDRHFARELDAHLNEQAQEEAKEESIREAVERYMAVGGEFHPFNPEHVAEALGEINALDMAKIANFLWLGDVRGQAFITEAVKAYWRKHATAEAEHDWEGHVHGE